MKTLIASLLAAVAGFTIGIILPAEKPAGTETQSTNAVGQKSALREQHWSAAKLPDATRMQAIVEKAATLSRDDWPAFFSSQLNSPESSRLAARLWAEADPAGFWAWLRKDFDALIFDEFAGNLVTNWALADPDAAMDAVSAITDKRLGGQLRRKVIDTVIDEDLQKGIALAARAGDFNRFGWGPNRKWLHLDPKAAVIALATLPAVSDYRQFLNYATPIWAESDPSAALAWLAAAPRLPDGAWPQEWLKNGFAAVAKADPAAALAAARAFDDPKQRSQALAGMVASGTLDLASLKEVLHEMPLADQRMLGSDLIRSRPSATVADLRETSELLVQLPSDRNNLNAVSSLADDWQRTDREAGWKWANSLTDPAMRRRAFAKLAPGASPEQLGTLPLLDLSTQLFESTLRKIPANQRDTWIARLPASHAAWARSVTP